MKTDIKKTNIQTEKLKGGDTVVKNIHIPMSLLFFCKPQNHPSQCCAICCTEDRRFCWNMFYHGSSSTKSLNCVHYYAIEDKL